MIGTTPITNFEGVEIEFRNVDQALTEAAMPDLADKVIAWRTGDEAMTLYPDDIVEDNYSVKLVAGDDKIVIGQETYQTYPDQTFGENGTLGQPVDVVRSIFAPAGSPVVRETRDRVREASVDISFQGLVKFSGSSKKRRSVVFGFKYREVGAVNWVDAGNEEYVGNSTALLRFSKSIKFPNEGRYEIETRRLTEDSDDPTVRDESFLTAIRSFRSGELPSHPDIAEIAIRVRASDQLNSQIDTLNAIVQRLAPVWDGAAWSAPVPVRHPAWAYAFALTGPMMKKPVSDQRLQLDDFKAWADEEPHWTFDMVFDQPTRLADVLDMIAAAGRAKRVLRDLKYSVVRDGGAGPIVQFFSPHNSYDFKARVVFPKEIHGFRVQVRSERLEWEQDEIFVFADGYDATNATEFETLPLPGVVLTKDDVDGGNAWRLGRYHLAQAILRPEEFEWFTDLEHLPCSMGSKIRLVHDVALIGVGSARVRGGDTVGNDVVRIWLDESFDITVQSYRLRVRSEDGLFTTFTATPSVDPADREWQILEAGVLAANVKAGDLVIIEEIGQESFDVLVTGIYHEGDLKARLTGVPAAPEVLLADQGAIPIYDPRITDYSTIERPAAPVVTNLITGELAAVQQLVGPDVVRIGVELQRHTFGGAAPTHYRLRWREVGLVSWEFTDSLLPSDILYTLALEPYRSYEVEVQSLGRSGQTKGWIAAGTIFAFASEEFPGGVVNFKLRVTGDQAFLTWDRVNSNVSHYELRHSQDAAASWEQAVLVDPRVEITSAVVPAIAGAYFIKSVSYADNKSPTATIITLAGRVARQANVVEVVMAHPNFEGATEGDVFLVDNALRFSTGVNLFEIENIFDMVNIFSGGDVPAQGVFVLDKIVDLGTVSVSRVSADMRGHGSLPGFNLYEVENLFDVQNIFGDADGKWALTLQISTTDDDPNVAPVWSDWTPLLVGDYEARPFRFCVVFDITDPQVEVDLEHLAITVDMPGRAMSGENVICPIGGVSVDFEVPYFAKPSVIIRGEGLPEQAEQKTTLITRSGFHQEFFYKDGNSIAATFDWQAAGYGRIEQETI